MAPTTHAQRLTGIAKRLGLVVLASIAISAQMSAIVSAQTATPLDFRGIELGTSLADLRRIVFPEARGAQILCTHDLELQHIRPIPDLAADEAAARAGAIACAALALASVPGLPAGSRQTELSRALINAGGIDVQPVYWLVPAPGGEVEETARLYRIVLRSNADFWPRTIAAFTRRYGQPTEAGQSAFTSDDGRRLANGTAFWRVGETSIQIVQRNGSVSRMTIVYEHHGLSPEEPQPVPQQGPQQRP